MSDFKFTQDERNRIELMLGRDLPWEDSIDRIEQIVNERDGWIRVEYGLPKYGERVQMFFPELPFDKIQGGYCVTNDAGQILFYRDKSQKSASLQAPTHWQPLPPPPKTEQ